MVELRENSIKTSLQSAADDRIDRLVKNQALIPFQGVERNVGGKRIRSGVSRL